MEILKIISKSPAVTSLQNVLNFYKYKLSVSGNFDNATLNAVKDFQQKNGLVADGTVEDKTWRVLFMGKSNAPGSEVLKSGSKGDAVKRLQEILKSKGHNVGIDGDFGDNTFNALKDFQLKNKLVADGVVGYNTWISLYSSPVPTPTPSVSGKFLTENDIKETATELGVEVASVKAVYEVESSGKGFLDNGDPKILFEGHIFWKELQKRSIDPNKHRMGNEDILYPKWDKSFYKSGIAEYDRLNRAKKINEEAALASASWGTFQIMGFNYSICGFDSVKSFVDAHFVNEGRHLKAFGSFITKNNLLIHLKNKNWAAFAKGYNGPAYAQNNYDKKLENAYKKYA